MRGTRTSSKWRQNGFGAKTPLTANEQAEQMIAQHIVDGFDNSNLSYVNGADGRDYVINVSVRLEVAFDSLRRKS
jgi:hypothetical protein